MTAFSVQTWPTCNVCGKPVECMAVFRRENESPPVTVWAFTCHGDTDEMQMDDLAMIKLDKEIFRDIGRFMQPFANKPRRLTDGGTP